MPPEDDDEGEHHSSSPVILSANYSTDEDDGADYENDVDVVYEPDIQGGLQVASATNRILNILRGLDDGAEDDDDEAEMQWDAPQAPAIIRGHHHHHIPRSPFDMFGMIGGDIRGMLFHFSIAQTLVD